MVPSIPINWTSPFPILGVPGVLFSIFISFQIEIPISKQCRPDQMPCPVVSDLDLPCLPRSHVEEARHI